MHGYRMSKVKVKAHENLYNKAQFILVCPPPPWPYLWTDFETKGTYGLPMTQG